MGNIDILIISRWPGGADYWCWLGRDHKWSYAVSSWL